MTTTFATIGSGRRTRFFLRLARAMPERLRVSGVVTRSPVGARDAGVCSAWASTPQRSGPTRSRRPLPTRSASTDGPVTTPQQLTTTIATIAFGGKMGVYDFTDNQWWNPLRSRRIVIRGSIGELVDDRVIRLVDPSTPVESLLIRRQTGMDLNLELLDLKHISFDGRVRWSPAPRTGPAEAVTGVMDRGIANVDTSSRTAPLTARPSKIGELCYE